MLNEETRRDFERMSDQADKELGALRNARKTGMLSRDSAEKLHDLVEQLIGFLEIELHKNAAEAAAAERGEIEPVAPVEDEPCSEENTAQPSAAPTANMPGSLSFSQPSGKKGGRTKT